MYLGTHFAGRAIWSGRLITATLLHSPYFCPAPALPYPTFVLPGPALGPALLHPCSSSCPPQFGSLHYHQHLTTFFGTARAAFHGTEKVSIALWWQNKQNFFVTSKGDNTTLFSCHFKMNIARSESKLHVDYEPLIPLIKVSTEYGASCLSAHAGQGMSFLPFEAQ